MAMLLSTQALMILYSASLVAGLNVTAPPSDDQPVGWQAGDDHRSTWAIASSCLSTIFACTWSVQHLNVPGRSDGGWVRFLRCCKWMMINILFPEFIVLHAVFEYAIALQALGLMKDKATYPWWHPGSKPLSTSVR